MKPERIVTPPDNYAPFLLSQGIKLGNLLFISGQAGSGEDGKIVPGGFREQGEQAFANLRRVLEAGGSSMADVVKVTIFVTDMGNFQHVVELRRKFFAKPYPADTIAEVKALYLHTTEFEAWQPAFEEGASLAPIASRYSGLPVLANGSLHDPERALELMSDHGAEMITLGRGALIRADWPRRLAQGVGHRAFDRRILAPLAAEPFLIMSSRRYLDEVTTCSCLVLRPVRHSCMCRY